MHRHSPKRLAQIRAAWNNQPMGSHGKNLSPFGRALQEQLRIRGVTSRAELAEKVGMGPSTLTGWTKFDEHGASGLPRVALAMAVLLDELGCAPMDLVAGELHGRPGFERVSEALDSDEKPSPEEVGAWWDKLTQRERRRVLRWIREEGLPERQQETGGRSDDKGTE